MLNFGQSHYPYHNWADDGHWVTHADGVAFLGFGCLSILISYDSKTLFQPVG